MTRVYTFSSNGITIAVGFAPTSGPPHDQDWEYTLYRDDQVVGSGWTSSEGEAIAIAQAFDRDTPRDATS